MDNNNKSLFLYTALIFFVAVILIILAFFGQTHIEKSQLPLELSSPQTTMSGITEKASVVSEENVRLMQEVSELKDEIAARDETIDGLNSQIDALNTVQDNNMLLFHAYASKASGNEDDLREVLSTINYEQLTPEQRNIYDNLNK